MSSRPVTAAATATATATASADAAPARAEWAQSPERSNALALRVMTWIALACGRRVTRWLLVPITVYFVLCSPTARRHSRRYLDRALGRPAGWRDGYRHVFTFTATVLDRVYLLRRQLPLFDLRHAGTELLDAALAEGRGAFLVGAHVGSFEALGAVGRFSPGARIAMVMYPDNAQKLNAALAAIAPDAERHVIALGRMESMLTLRDWLDGGGLAGMLADRSLPGESMRAGAIGLPFLGHEAQFSDGPFRLAALLRRRVFFMAAPYRGGNRYDARFELLADFSQPAANGAEREQRIREAVQAYAARLEALCREHPYNWFNFHDFWGEDAARPAA